MPKQSSNNVSGSNGQEPLLKSNGETAVLLGVSTKSLERMRKCGKGPRYIKEDGVVSRVYYPYEEIKKWLANNLKGEGRPLHAFNINNAGAILSPATDLLQPNVIVGSLLELLTEEQWEDFDVFQDAAKAYRDEQADELAAINDAQIILDRRLLQAHCPPGVGPKIRGPF